MSIPVHELQENCSRDRKKCLIKDGHSTKCNRNERKYRNKQFLHRIRKMCKDIKKKVKSFLKDNTDPIPHLHPCINLIKVLCFLY